MCLDPNNYWLWAKHHHCARTPRWCQLFPQGDVKTDLVPRPVESLVEIKSEDELSFNSILSNECEGLKEYSVSLLIRVKITLDKENNLELLEFSKYEKQIFWKIFLSFCLTQFGLPKKVILPK